MEQSATSEAEAPSTPAPAGDNGAPNVDAEAGAGTTSPNDNWRSALAGEDESFAEDLANYENLADVGALLREQRAALAERPKVPALPDDPTDEQLADYRAALGIPEVASDYDYVLPDEYEPSEL